jgi:hypothetical protein
VFCSRYHMSAQQASTRGVEGFGGIRDMLHMTHRLDSMCGPLTWYITYSQWIRHQGHDSYLTERWTLECQFYREGSGLCSAVEIKDTMNSLDD